MSVVLGLLDLGPSEMLIVGIVAVLLFGERLPEVGRTFGKKFIDFKKGLQGIEEQITSIGREITSPTSNSHSSSGSSKSNGSVTTGGSNLSDYAEATAPKFEPPPDEPPAGPAGA